MKIVHWVTAAGVVLGMAWRVQASDESTAGRSPVRSAPVFVRITDQLPQPVAEPAGYPAEQGWGTPVADSAPSVMPTSYGCADCGAGVPCGCDNVISNGIPACAECCPPVWQHCSGIYGGFLYLRPRDADVAYAAPIDGPIVGPPANNPIIVGQLGIVDPDYQPGFYAGLTWALSPCSSVDVRYSMFESSTNDRVSTSAPNVIRSLVAHPSTQSAATDFLSARAQLEIDFDTLDVDFRRVLLPGDLHVVNFLLGARCAQLDQRFASEFQNNGTETVVTDMDFSGGGIRLGLDAERYSCSRQFSIYARGVASFLAGQFRGNYFQGSSVDPEVVNTQWEAGRIVPVLDVELGVHWTSAGGRLRVGAGYLVSSWFNTPKTEDFVRSVQRGDFVSLDDTLTFDGLTTHAELRW